MTRLGLRRGRPRPAARGCRGSLPPGRAIGDGATKRGGGSWMGSWCGTCERLRWGRPRTRRGRRRRAPENASWPQPLTGLRAPSWRRIDVAREPARRGACAAPCGSRRPTASSTRLRRSPGSLRKVVELVRTVRIAMHVLPLARAHHPHRPVLVVHDDVAVAAGARVAARAARRSCCPGSCASRGASARPGSRAAWGTRRSRTAARR